MITEFLEFILDVKGNISPVKFKHSYFIKNNKEELWTWFDSKREQFKEYSDRDIILLLSNNIDYIPKCIVCGNPAKVQKYKGKSNISYEYCSKLCSHKSEKRSAMISATKKNYSDTEREYINSKRENTMLQKYGVSYNSQRIEVKDIISEKLSKRQLSPIAGDYLLDESWLYNEYVLKSRTSVDIADELGVTYYTVLDYCRKYGYKIRKYSNESLPQKQIYEFIKEIYSGTVLYNDWSVLKSKELDIYLPELNLAIEHNGIYTHSSSTFCNKNKFRHLLKTDSCEQLGITLLHIREDQWKSKQDIVKSIIKSKIGVLDYKLYARKCIIKDVSSKESVLFLNENHIQGNINSSIKYGLYYNDELVSLMTFSKTRNKSKGDWELVRFCNKCNYSVVGSFSKLLKHFRMMNVGSIISYCDRSRSYGDVYLKTGFSLLHKTSVGYSWTDKREMFSREKFQKHKLNKVLKQYDPNLSEFENMFLNGYRVLYNSGQLVFFLQ